MSKQIINLGEAARAEENEKVLLVMDPESDTLAAKIYRIIAEACVKSEAIGAEKERAAVVKFLRSVDNDVLRRWADAIEKGEHIP